MPIQPETNGQSCSRVEDTNVGRADVIAPLVSYGGHDQETRDVPADQIPPHPTGVNETIIVEDGVNQAGSTLLRG